MQKLSSWKKQTREQYEVKKQKSYVMRKGKMFIVSTLWKYTSSFYNASYLLYLFVVSLFFSIIHLFLTIFFISLITLPVRLSSDTSWFSIRFLKRFLCESETDRASSSGLVMIQRSIPMQDFSSASIHDELALVFHRVVVPSSPLLLVLLISLRTFFRRTDGLKNCIWFTSCSMSHKNIKQKIQFAPF